jgi:hypothetical protein
MAFNTTITDVAPLAVSYAKYVLLIVGSFNILPNDGLVFISSNQQSQTTGIPDNVFKTVCALLGNAFYTWSPPVEPVPGPRRLNGSATGPGPGGATDPVQWVQDHLFMLNMGCLLFLVGVLTSLYFCCQFCRKSQPGISYRNYIIRTMLVSYYSLTNMALLYLLGPRESLALAMMAVAVLFFNTLCLPLYCVDVLRRHREHLNTRRTLRDYGCIYQQYHGSMAYFGVAGLLKQLVYSLVFVLSHVRALTWVAGLVAQAVVNVLFVAVLLRLTPFNKRLYQIQALLTCGVKLVILVTAGIVGGHDTRLGAIVQSLYASIFAINAACFLLPFLPCYKVYLRRTEELERRRSVDAVVESSTIPAWAVEDYVAQADQESVTL